jgi:hypothetical protein
MAKPAGRDDIAAALAAGVSIPIDQARNVVRALFGSGGSDHTPGLIEQALDRGELNIRCFGMFRRVERKGGARVINGRELVSRHKSKISFTASRATDIIK